MSWSDGRAPTSQFKQCTTSLADIGSNSGQVGLVFTCTSGTNVKPQSVAPHQDYSHYNIRGTAQVH